MTVFETKEWTLCFVSVYVCHLGPTQLIKLQSCNSFERWNKQAGGQTNHVFSCCLFNFIRPSLTVPRYVFFFSCKKWAEEIHGNITYQHKSYFTQDAQKKAFIFLFFSTVMFSFVLSTYLILDYKTFVLHL